MTRERIRAFFTRFELQCSRKFRLHGNSNRVKKALSVQKSCVPSVCWSSRTAAAAARRDQSIMISIMMRLATSALRLHVIVIRAASTAAGAISKETRSFSTELSLHRWSGRALSATTCRVAHHRSSVTPAYHRLTTLRPSPELSTLLSRTLTYALVRSGRARRDLHVQPNHSTPYGC